MRQESSFCFFLGRVEWPIAFSLFLFLPCCSARRRAFSSAAAGSETISLLSLRLDELKAAAGLLEEARPFQFRLPRKRHVFAAAKERTWRRRPGAGRRPGLTRKRCPRQEERSRAVSWGKQRTSCRRPA